MDDSQAVDVFEGCQEGTHIVLDLRHVHLVKVRFEVLVRKMGQRKGDLLPMPHDPVKGNDMVCAAGHLHESGFVHDSLWDHGRTQSLQSHQSPAC